VSTVRTRRLRHDHEALLRLCEQTRQRIVLERVEGEPPGLYVLALHCRSVACLQDGQPLFTTRPRVRIQLPALYPAEPPQAAVLSPIFHPHIWPNRMVCLGKWSPAEKLDSLVLRIASILIFDPAQFNWKSVANHEAAAWAQHHPQLFPLDDLFQPAPPQPSTGRLLQWSEGKRSHG
jgi:hypothetical protein